MALTSPSSASCAARAAKASASAAPPDKAAGTSTACARAWIRFTAAVNAASTASLSPAGSSSNGRAASLTHFETAFARFLSVEFVEKARMAFAAAFSEAPSEVVATRSNRALQALT